MIIKRGPLFKALILIALLSGCTSASVPPEPPKTIDELAAQLDEDGNQKVKLLFVLSAKTGTINKLNTSNHQFSVEKADLTRLVAFTDRPERYAFDLSIPMFKALWSGGKDSFAVDPPNAVLVDDSGRIAITMLTGLLDEPDNLTLRLDKNAYRAIDADETPWGTELTNPVLVIDASILTAAGLAGLLRAGAQACVEVECYWALAGG
jgi:hypothetical protein